MSSTVASLGRLIVLEIAPLMNGWAAAIMRMWPSTGMKRWPCLPHLLAQSKTGRCSRLQVRRALDGAAAADDVVGLVDLLAGEAELAEQVEAGRLPLVFGDLQALEECRRRASRG